MKKSKTQNVKRKGGSQQRVVKPRLSDLVKAAHEAGAKVSVSLEPKTKPYWHISYIEEGQVRNQGVMTELGVVATVARCLTLGATSISIMAGSLKEVA